jgi:hypothetical protein
MKEFIRPPTAIIIVIMRLQKLKDCFNALFILLQINNKKGKMLKFLFIYSDY